MKIDCITYSHGRERRLLSKTNRDNRKCQFCSYYRQQTKFAKVMFLHVSVCHSVHGERGWCLLPGAGCASVPRPPGHDTPYPNPGRHPPGTRHPHSPGTSHAPPGAGACSDRHPLGPDTPLPGQAPPWDQTPPWAGTPPDHTPHRTRHPPPMFFFIIFPHWEADSSIWSTGGWYAYYWNAFLFYSYFFSQESLDANGLFPLPESDSDSDLDLDFCTMQKFFHLLRFRLWSTDWNIVKLGGKSVPGIEICPQIGYSNHSGKGIRIWIGVQVHAVEKLLHSTM